ncbi:MAG: glycogen/starch synthase [Deltaproteobacteria bacterium]|nr:glycogen/starch synthase [Deltaproteobacteria bacterium]
MEILFVSPEVAPFVRTSSVADVSASLPKALRSLGHRVHVVTLLHGSPESAGIPLAKRLSTLSIELGQQRVEIERYEARLASGVTVTLLNLPGITDRSTPYGHADDHKRFAVLAKGAIALIQSQPERPDIVHAHDWAAALVPLFLSLAQEKDASLRSIRTVLTAYDAESRGLFDRSTLREINVPERLFSPDELEFYGKVCWLKHGVLKADKVTVPSPTYARELLQPESGRGLEGVFAHRGKDVLGVLHGVDFSVYNPATDPHLIARFDAEGTLPREACRADLAEQAGLPARPEPPVFAYVGPIDAARGMDLLAACAARIIRNDARWVLAGDGDASLVESFEALAKRFPDRVSFRRTYSEAFFHKVLAGADFWIAPARREPGASAHLYAMRYGTIPVARASGAVRDAVVDCDPKLDSGTGFLFSNPDPDELFGAIGRALAAFRRKDQLARVRHRAMRRDLSWDRCARQYESLYKSLVERVTQPAALTA